MRGNPSIYYDPTGLVLISFLGDFTGQEPTEAQLKSAAETAAWLMKQYNMATTAVTGHRDHAPTTCPGDNLYRLLQDGSFAKRVRESLTQARLARAPIHSHLVSTVTTPRAGARLSTVHAERRSALRSASRPVVPSRRVVWIGRAA